MDENSKRSVTSAELVRQFGLWRQSSRQEPLFVTHHGRDTHVLLTVEAFRDLRSSTGSLDARNREQMLEQLAANVDQGVVLCDADQKIILVNRIAYSVAEREQGSLTGMNLWEAFPELEGSLQQIYIRRTFASREPSWADLPCLFRSNCWSRFGVVALDGGVAILFRDITEDVERHRLADRKTSLLNAITLHGEIGTAFISNRGILQEVNGVLCNMVGLSEERLTHVALTDIVPVTRRVQLREDLDFVLRGDGSRRVESEFLTNQGKALPVTMAIEELRGAYGTEGAVLIATRH